MWCETSQATQYFSKTRSMVLPSTDLGTVGTVGTAHVASVALTKIMNPWSLHCALPSCHRSPENLSRRKNPWVSLLKDFHMGHHGTSWDPMLLFYSSFSPPPVSISGSISGSMSGLLRLKMRQFSFQYQYPTIKPHGKDGFFYHHCVESLDPITTLQGTVLPHWNRSPPLHQAAPSRATLEPSGELTFCHGKIHHF